MSKICQIFGKTANNAYNVSHSHVRTKKKQHVNLQRKRIWCITNSCWIKKKVSTKAIKSLNKINLKSF